jgi:WD40 repeat protein
LLSLQGQTNSRINNVVFSPDGKRLAIAEFLGTARVYEANSGREVLTLRGVTDVARSTDVAFSPDGKRLATAGDGKIWDAESGRELLTLSGRTGSIVVFSPDGNRLATADSQTATVWDSRSGQELLTLSGHMDFIDSVAFSPDSKRLATVGQDGIVQVYALDIQSLLKLAKKRITRPFTPDDCQRYFSGGGCPKTP